MEASDSRKIQVRRPGMEGYPAMEFERYYLDLFEMLSTCAKKIASGKYDKADTDRLFELAKEKRYPAIFTELAESFGMMMVKVEAREFLLKQLIEELETDKNKVRVDSDTVLQGQ
jgi:hypothetical protein